MNENPHDENLLAALLEDRLDGREQARLMEHLASCAECRETLATLARGADLLPLPVSASTMSPVRRWPLAGTAWLPLAAMLVLAAAIVTTRPSWWAQPGDRRPPQSSPSGEVAGEPRGGSPPGTVAPSPEGATRVSPPPASTQSSGSEGRGTVLRGAQRSVAGKTFRLVFGEWIDLAFDPAAALPSVDVKTDEDRAAVLARLPALAPYAALGERVLVVHQGTAYRFGPRPPG